MTQSEKTEIHLIPHTGLIVNDNRFLTLYHHVKEPDMFNPNAQFLQPKALLGLFKKSLPETKEIDKAFKYSGISRTMAETSEAMQKNLSLAQERGEQLRELEIKAQQLRNAAANYHRLARELAGK